MEFTKTILVTSSLNAIVNSGLIQHERLTNLTHVILGGEQIHNTVLIKIMSLLPHTTFYNCYGSTETLCTAIFTLNTPPHSEGEILPIGFPIGDNQFVLDTTDFPYKENKGELIVFGPQVGTGYWNDTEKTKAAFGVNEKGERFYRTGDIASFDPERGYFIHGRKDSQIKFMGYRISLGEIERVVSSVPFITENIIIPLYGDGEARALKLVYAAERDCEKEILAHLKKNLPKYMIPQYFVRFEKLPKNKSNKIDRALLKEKYGNF